MSASIRINIIGGTEISAAYEDCAAVSERLGGISVETNFNGVEMFFYHQPKEAWFDEYKRKLFGMKKQEGDEV